MARKTVFNMASVRRLEFLKIILWSRECHRVPNLLLCAKFYKNQIIIFAARCYAQAWPMPSCGLCPSVCLWILPKRVNHIVNFFSPPGNHSILVFPHQTSWQCSNGNRLNGASNAGGGRRQKLGF